MKHFRSNKGFQATAHKLSLCDRLRTLQSYTVLPVGRRLNPDVRDKKMKVSRGTLTALHVIMHCVALVCIASVYFQWPYLIPMFLALLYVLAAPPLFLSTKKIMDRNDESSSLSTLLSQLALIFFWILSLCLLILLLSFTAAIHLSGIGPQD